MRAVFALLAGALAGLAGGYAKWNWAGQRAHWDERLAAIESQADQMPPGGVVVLGDSITEYQRITDLCGKPALNAGIAWARTADWIPEARNVIRRARPSLVILAIGFNDRASDKWKSDYARLVKISGAKLAVGTDDRQKDAFIRSLLPLAPRPSIAKYGRHPNAAGAALWRDGLNTLCHGV